MPFSKEWEEKVYGQGKQVNNYPFTDLVSLVTRHCNLKRFKEKPKVLELGCGTGPNISFFLDKQFDYYGIEGSKSAIEIIKNRFGEDMKVTCCDFTETLPFKDGFFDLIVDRSAVIHNCRDEINKVIKECYRTLNENGRLIITGWFSTMHSMFGEGEEVLDSHSRSEYTEGQFKDIGIVHFTDREEILELFDNGWIIESLVHNTLDVIIPNAGSKAASFRIVVSKEI